MRPKDRRWRPRKTSGAESVGAALCLPQRQPADLLCCGLPAREMNQGVVMAWCGANEVDWSELPPSGKGQCGAILSDGV
jgi:hypothetical protein